MKYKLDGKVMGNTYIYHLLYNFVLILLILFNDFCNFLNFLLYFKITYFRQICIAKKIHFDIRINLCCC